MVCVREIQLFNSSKELRRDPYMRKNSPQVIMRDTREGGFEIEEEQGSLGIEAESPVDGRINIILLLLLLLLSIFFFCLSRGMRSRLACVQRTTSERSKSPLMSPSFQEIYTSFGLTQF